MGGPGGVRIPAGEAHSQPGEAKLSSTPPARGKVPPARRKAPPTSAEPATDEPILRRFTPRHSGDRSTESDLTGFGAQGVSIIGRNLV
jgi:hypothetical protein